MHVAFIGIIRLICVNSGRQIHMDLN